MRATRSFLAFLLALLVLAAPIRADLLQTDLYFGRNIPGGGQVSEFEFQQFVDSVITPRFPAGLTIFDTLGQYQDGTGILIEEPSKVVSLFFEGTPASQASLDEIAGAYLRQFRQESVLQVANRDDLAVSFSLGDDLFLNSAIPRFLQTDLYFGRNIAGGGQVSEPEFQQFVDSVITPRFPAGLTIFDAGGQFLDSTGTRIEEPSKAVTLLLEDTLANETLLNEIIEAYLLQFNQQSVLAAANQDVTVSFGLGGDLIDNDPLPEFIQTDLYFGRNIPGGGQVSESAFQQFVDSVITPRFPAGLTIFDTLGQFQDNAGTLIQEPSKVVTLLLEDTLANETLINEIIGAYLLQFNQESVLAVVDEDIDVRFVGLAADVPEPSSLALLASSLLPVLARLRRGPMAARRRTNEKTRA